MSSDGNVVVITGAGQGLGRAYALALARHGFRLVVNDIRREAADAVVAEIRAAGGTAAASGDDVSDWDAAACLVAAAVDTYGRLDLLVNNAGILRDRPFVDMTAQEWDDTIRVHLRGAFCPSKHAVRHWLSRADAGERVDGRILNTTSPSGLYATIDQAHYGAAKAGVAAFTLILAQEVASQGIAVNAIAPTALTAMTDHRAGYLARVAEVERRTGWNPGSTDNVAALVVWLASPRAHGVTGRVFNIRGGHVSLAENWTIGPSASREGDWDVETIDATLPDLLAETRALHNVYGERKEIRLAHADRGAPALP
ncbi:SDR family NAD(P)-dependent oxidoreductase [Dactylosporangium sp. NPDC005572]|uniref:SDR family NAD(P)-dependent oxidoreductase n=1 Tax=Dactylosporangium sp. NPDC005572 TaxID=3156889 RepID=UPI0033A00251